MQRHNTRLGVSLLLILALAACSYRSSDTYRVGETGRKLDVERAVILSSREVVVTDDSDVQNNYYGPIAGGTIAGVGSSVAGAPGAIVLGAVVLGLGLGYLIEEAAETRTGHEYVLQNPDTGKEYALVVSAPSGAELLPPGTAVRVVGSRDYTRLERDLSAPAALDASEPTTSE